MADAYKIAALYQFSPLPGFVSLQEPLLAKLNSLGICGSLLIAEEGINGTIAGKPEQLHQALQGISNITGLKDFNPKFSFAGEKPFRRMKVRLKKEIVTIGPVKANPSDMVGTYVEAKDWNTLIDDPNIVLIDTRNSYEFGVGTFKGALDPHTESFGEFPDWVRAHLADKKQAKIAMFCTGGIRCEKASSFMRHEGFENVFHLKGGILKYLEDVKAEDSRWEGGCFVFDERVAVGHGLRVLDFSASVMAALRPSLLLTALIPSSKKACAARPAPTSFRIRRKHPTANANARLISPRNAALNISAGFNPSSPGPTQCSSLSKAAACSAHLWPFLRGFRAAVQPASDWPG